MESIVEVSSGDRRNTHYHQVVGLYKACRLCTACSRPGDGVQVITSEECGVRTCNFGRLFSLLKYFFPTFLYIYIYIPGPVMKAFDPSF